MSMFSGTRTVAYSPHTANADIEPLVRYRKYYQGATVACTTKVYSRRGPMLALLQTGTMTGLNADYCLRATLRRILALESH